MVKKNWHIQEALSGVGLEKGETIMVYSDLRAFGFIKDQKGEFSLKITPDKLHQALREVLGNEGTIIVPTFTYSWTKGDKPYYHDSSPSDVGIFTEYMRKLEGSDRSIHPIFSVVSNGPDTEIIADLDKTSFGEGSIFGKMHMMDIKQVMIGTPDCTFGIYIECMAEVPYRYTKVFRGSMIVGDRRYQDEYSYYVKYLGKSIEGILAHNSTYIPDSLDSKIRKAKFGRSFVKTIGSNAMFNEVYPNLKKKPFYYMNRPPDDSKAMVFINNLSKVPIGNSSISLTRYAVTLGVAERWVWRVEGVNFIDEVSIRSEDRGVTIGTWKSICNIIVDTFQGLELDEVVSDAELRKHILPENFLIREDYLNEMKWIVMCSDNDIEEKIERDETYSVRIKLSIGNADKKCNNQTLFIVSPGRNGNESGSDLSFSLVNNLLRCGIESKKDGDSKKLEVITHLLKTGFPYLLITNEGKKNGLGEIERRRKYSAARSRLCIY